MTRGRAALLGLMDQYLVLGYDYSLSLLEIQKLAYFLQEAGEPLRLKYTQEQYGPYADNLRHVLNRIEGHFISGIGDGENKPNTSITLIQTAVNEAQEFLNKHPDIQPMFHKVSKLIEGFETPYGMELLASVHWITKYDEGQNSRTPEAITKAVHEWNDRKKTLMKPQHIIVAFERLKQQGWLSKP